MSLQQHLSGQQAPPNPKIPKRKKLCVYHRLCDFRALAPLLCTGLSLSLLTNLPYLPIDVNPGVSLRHLAAERRAIGGLHACRTEKRSSQNCRSSSLKFLLPVLQAYSPCFILLEDERIASLKVTSRCSMESSVRALWVDGLKTLPRLDSIRRDSFRRVYNIYKTISAFWAA